MTSKPKCARALISDFDGDGVVYGFHCQPYFVGQPALVVTLNSGNHQTEFTLGEDDFGDFSDHLEAAGKAVLAAIAKARGQ